MSLERWSTRTHEHVQKACEDGAVMVERLAKLSAQVYSVGHAFGVYAGELPLTEYGEHEGVPNKLYFVPHAKALMFYKATKAGFLVGLEQGSGFVIARVGGPTSNKWSAPAFIRVAGVEFGLVAGMDRAETLVGVMGERALESMLSDDGKFTMGSSWNFSISPLEADKSGSLNPSWIFNTDFSSVSLAKGIMADVGIQGTRFYFDNMWNEKCYGSDITSRQILRGDVPPPPELSAFSDKLQTCCSPQLAGIHTELRPSMFGPAGTAAGGTAGTAAATTTTAAATETVTTRAAEPASLPAAAVVTPAR